MANKTGITPAEIRTSELYGVAMKAVGEARPYSDADLEDKIRAAEDFYERRLQVRFGTKRVVSAGPERGLIEGDDYDISEAPYTYRSDLFYASNWGSMELRMRPVVSIQKFAFAFPDVSKPMFTPDPKWIRLDHKYGQINLVPTSGPTVLIALNSFILTAIGGGFDIPKSILIDYTVGYPLSRLRGDYSDLLQGIKMRTCLYLLPGLGVALTGGRSSTSLSLDGMSESGGFLNSKFGPYGGIIEAYMLQEKEILQNFLDTEKGVGLVVL